MSPADIILENANAITMDSRCPSAEVVAIEAEQISTVGNSHQVASVKGAGTRIIDCGGKTLLPGFNDAHLHLFTLMRSLLDIDVSPTAVRSIADIKEAVWGRAQSAPPGTWLSGTGYNEFYLAEKRCPNRWDLDEAAPDHPVVISHRSLHACVLNSLALSLAALHSSLPGAGLESS